MILGFAMCCIANGLGADLKLVGGLPAADLELALPAEYAPGSSSKAR
jgi:hypothetical protein